MVVVPLSSPVGEVPVEPVARRSQSNDWLRVAASGSLLIGGVLLVTGKRRIGLIAAITGAALTMADQQETVRIWWDSLPGLINDASRMLNQVQGVVDNVNAQSARLRALVQK
jgi:hypothetical protein